MTKRHVMKVAGRKVVLYALDVDNDVYRPVRCDDEGRLKVIED